MEGMAAASSAGCAVWMPERWKPEDDDTKPWTRESSAHALLRQVSMRIPVSARLGGLLYSVQLYGSVCTQYVRKEPRLLPTTGRCQV